MSILIKGIKMPSCCEVCPCNDDDWRCGALGERFEDIGVLDLENRPSFCPLVEVPEPHGRLIDADFMKELGAKCIAKRCDDGVLLALGRIDDLPTVIEAEE